ncbi:cytochrome P450 [Radiomyces spectabilis]|uniref:cytochrome P450 n=1 Tax=Radiomyces spectabilis TaxID=64574 RepID=UPI0022204359|nr:cytochrome P450 [Radiomyces spectabilis]KAI8393608.1 cytochrome P450 [Radiomyces spectabilis]
MGNGLSAIVSIGLTFLLSQVMTKVIWANKYPDGKRKQAWPTAPSQLPYFWNAFDAFHVSYCKSFTEWSQKIGTLFSVKIGQKRVIVLNEPKLVRQTFVEMDQYNSSRTLSDTVEVIMSDNGKTVFTAPFTLYWSRLRRGINKVIGKSQYHGWMDLFHRQAEKFVNGISLNDAKVVEADQLRQLVELIALHISLHIVVGEEVDPETMLTLTQKVQKAEVWQKESWHIYSRFFPVVRQLYVAFTALLGNRSITYLRNDILEIFLTVQKDEQKGIAAALADIAPSKNDPTPEQLTKDQILVNLVHLTVHSYKYLSAALFSALQRVATSADWQNKMLDKDPEQALRYAKAFINEVLRYDGPVKMFSHAARVDYELTVDDKAYRVDEDVELVANLDAIHFDERYYAEPHQFNPDRFLGTSYVSLLDEKVPTSKGLNARDHLAFGAGRRACQGSLVAEEMLAAILLKVVQTYQLKHQGIIRTQVMSGVWSWMGRMETKGNDIEFIKRP